MRGVYKKRFFNKMNVLLIFIIFLPIGLKLYYHTRYLLLVYDLPFRQLFTFNRSNEKAVNATTELSKIWIKKLSENEEWDGFRRIGNRASIVFYVAIIAVLVFTL
jgi:hypothetical protein